MIKRTFENLGVETSLLGFGCMRFPMVDNKIDEPEAEKMIDYAIENGVNYIDTAYPYHDGDSEPFVGKVLKKYDRSKFFLATKLPMWEVNSIDDADRIFHEQLKRLNVDYIDFYLFHAVDEEKWKKILDLHVIDYFEEQRRLGKIRFLGLSFHDELDTYKKIINYRKWDFVQLQLNYIDIREQAGIEGYEIAKALGIPVIVMEPVKGGTLARLPEEVEALYKNYNPEASVASWAIRWCGTLDNVKVILSGMTTMEQVKDNLKTFNNFKPLSDKEGEIVKEVAYTLNSRMKNNCTDCRYCLPCPAGVNIPANFDRWNKFAVYGNKDEAIRRWTEFNDSEKAKNCIKCGACEKKCPQKINIRADLERLQKEMDDIV
jgi:predicted aldo/keto reductase-like oxidoreductase